jgi:checkpoint serine/threonine-protein kinase
MAGLNGIPATPTTDFALIQAQKENIVPLSTGRSAAILSNVLTKDRTEADRMVHEGHERHKRLIEETKSREAEGDELPVGVNDVLDPYCR